MTEEYERLVVQLVAAGLPEAQAISAIELNRKSSPVSGALQLQKLGANYHEAFKVLSAEHANQQNKAGANPVVLIIGGGSLCMMGAFEAFVALLGHPLVSPSSYLGFLFFGAFFFFKGLNAQLRKK